MLFKLPWGKVKKKEEIFDVLSSYILVVSEDSVWTDNHCKWHSRSFVFTVGKCGFKNHCVALKEKKKD